MLNTLIGLSFMVFLGLLILWYTGRRRQSPSKITGRHVLYSLALVIVLISISSALPGSTSESNSSEVESSAVSSKDSSSAKETENEKSNLKEVLSQVFGRTQYALLGMLTFK